MRTAPAILLLLVQTNETYPIDNCVATNQSITVIHYKSDVFDSTGVRQIGNGSMLVSVSDESASATPYSRNYILLLDFRMNVVIFIIYLVSVIMRRSI